MRIRFVSWLALAATVVLGACDDDDPTGPGTNATVQFINASSQAFDVLRSGTVVTGGSDIGFGEAASCMTNVVAATPALTLRQAGTTTAIPFTPPAFTAGNRYAIVVTGTPGNLHFNSIQHTYPTLTANQSGFRVLNVSGATPGYDVYVTAPGAALPTTANATNVTTGNWSPWFATASGNSRVRFTSTGTTTVAYQPADFTLTAGQRVIGVVAPPATGTTTNRFFTHQSCQ